MTIQSTGEISLGGTVVGRSVNLELRKTATASVSMNDTDVRGLTGIATGAISFSNFYGRSLSYAIVPGVSSVNEGGSVTFTVTTTGLLNGTVLFWSTNTVTGTVNTADFSDAVLTGSVTINNNTGSVTRTLTNDVTTEGAESFQLQLRTGSISGTIIATSAAVTVNDTSQPATYSVTPSVTSVNEGGSVTFTVNTTFVSNGTVLFWSTLPTTGTVNTADFSDAVLTGSVTINNNTGSVVRGISADMTAEGSESFQLRIHVGSTTGTLVATSTVVTINDTSFPTYSATQSTTSVNEGGSVTITVNTTNVPNGTVLFWSTNGTISPADFTDIVISGSFTINNNTGSIVRGIVADSFTEGAETFIIRIRTGSTAGTIVANSATITINDTSVSAARQVVFTSSGSWIVPSLVTRISMVTVGGGSGGRYGSLPRGGGGASTSYRNNFTVTPGETLTITIGAGGAARLNNPAVAAGQTRINRAATIICAANGGGANGAGAAITSISGVTSTTGGSGGSGNGGPGGGGTGGYGPSSLGGSGGTVGSASLAGTNGAGGGGGSTTTGTNRTGGKGGGVGLLGRGSNGTAIATINATLGTTGNNGSGGAFGAGGAGGNTTTLNTGRMNGNAGAVRIMWPGDARQYPSTGTTDS